MKKLLLVSIIAGTAMAADDSKQNLDSMYKYVFGKDGLKMSNTTAALLQCCSKQSGDYDQKACEQGKRRFNDIVQKSRDKALKQLNQTQLYALRILVNPDESNTLQDALINTNQANSNIKTANDRDHLAPSISEEHLDATQVTNHKDTVPLTEELLNAWYQAAYPTQEKDLNTKQARLHAQRLESCYNFPLVSNYQEYERSYEMCKAAQKELESLQELLPEDELVRFGELRSLLARKSSIKQSKKLWEGIHHR